MDAFSFDSIPSPSSKSTCRLSIGPDGDIFFQKHNFERRVNVLNLPLWQPGYSKPVIPLFIARSEFHALEIFKMAAS